MKKVTAPLLIALAAVTLLTGCIGFVGGGSTSKPQSATLGQQLIDLQKARDTGAISETEYQAQRSKLLGNP